MLRRTVLPGFCVLLAMHGLHAQTTSSLSGRVTDATTASPLVGAQVRVLLEDTNFSAVTEADGAYSFTGVPSGIHRVQVAFLGYGPVLVPEVWLRSGKVEVLDIAMQPASTEMGEAIVEGLAPRTMSPVSSYALTVEQSLRYPATFFDPARLASTRPGVAGTNDQANHFSVRGNGPSSNAWLLEGAEIVNPNHLTNAGTASDYPTLSGGGVTILSAQMLGTSQLLTGGMPTAYGNAIGGIMDLQLRRGVTEGPAFTAQAGLLGIDVSTEGPFSKGGDASYLVNYRYSTLGLLSAMSVDIGDEVITFQDLSFHVSLPVKRASISLFGLGGMSSNEFTAVEDSAEWQFDKDSQNIIYNASMGALGSTVKIPLGGRAIWHTTLVASENDQARDADGSLPRRGTFSEEARLSERKLTVESHLRGSLGSAMTYRIGGSVMERVVDKTLGVVEQTAGNLVRPYVHGGFAITEHLRLEAGLAYAYYSFNGADAIEPRGTLQYRFGGRSSVAVAVGQRSQLPQVQSFPVRENGGLLSNDRIGLTLTRDVVVAVDHAFQPHIVLHGEVFVQKLMDVPVADTTGILFTPAQGTSMANVWDAPVVMDLLQTGEGTNQGFEISLQHLFHRRLFYTVNATLFDATATDAFNAQFNARWNTGFIGNLVVGKEFEKQKDRLKRTWGVNVRANGMGGQRYPAPGSQYASGAAWSDQYASYYRIDLRMYVKREREGRSGMWALDLQNVTNAQNEAYRYFDTRKNEVVTKYQLGLIPNLSYRIEF